LLFVIASDVLAEIFAMAGRVGALETNRFIKPENRVSMYADDVVIFADPEQTKLSSIKAIIQCFGEASGLITNLRQELDHPNSVRWD
jgi:hypothetical protein